MVSEGIKVNEEGYTMLVAFMCYCLNENDLDYICRKHKLTAILEEKCKRLEQQAILF